MNVLVTGGAGYIGSHTVLKLLIADCNVVVIDNLSNSSRDSLKRVTEITGKRINFVKGDIRNEKLLNQLFCSYPIDAVLHFAGLKAVGESVSQPMRYYDNNVYGSQVLLQAMERAGVTKIVFSSSATVYGDPAQVPISESCPAARPTNPYGRSKLIVEDMLCDLAAAEPSWSIAILRYFNPVGAHESGLIGENPRGLPNNLLPYIAKVAIGDLPQLTIFGDDYPTPDGTGIRDYIHVMDLAEGHIKALEVLSTFGGANVWNLGTGLGFSVLDVVRTFKEISGREIPYRIAARRAGDVASCYANPAKATRDLNWKAERSLAEMIEDTWRWQTMNPNGF